MPGPLVYDISPPISPALVVWPGDTPPSREVLCDMKAGSNITLSTLRATVHLGAHADAPSHYGVNAPSIEHRNLDYYLGPCQVIWADVPRGARIERKHLRRDVRSKRVLIATGTFPDPQKFNEDFAAFSPALIDYFHTLGVKLVGIDTPSVDLFDSKDLPAHKRFLAHNMAILEGVVINDVPEGIYELIALPLKLVGFDASPVRAILRTI
ncbi:MAG: cyclase family protein [Phycisphaerales bacterium]|nr:cyclase family protein [Phycisphaerales bacterium]MCI0631427.1 cyclase family protein [Phycisphaerales bacterium]